MGKLVIINITYHNTSMGDIDPWMAKVYYHTVSDVFDLLRKEYIEHGYDIQYCTIKPPYKYAIIIVVDEQGVLKRTIEIKEIEEDER